VKKCESLFFNEKNRYYKQKMKKHTLATLIALILLTSGCTNITPEEVETAKQAFLSNDPDKCEEITDKTTSNICIMTVAQNTKDPEICERIEENQSKDGCITSLAFSTHDPLLCERLSKEKDRASCKKDIEDLQIQVSKELFTA